MIRLTSVDMLKNYRIPGCQFKTNFNAQELIFKYFCKKKALYLALPF
jgi:hypothetical protein